jgi:hypothetical protein
LIRTALPLVLVVFALLLAGCSAWSWKSSPPKAQVKGNIFATNGASTVVTMGVLQMKVMRFADEYVAAISQGADDFGARVGTPKGRLASLRWKLSQATAAYVDASGENPVINALDLLTLVTVSRMVVEDFGVETYGTNALPMIEIHRQLEARAWDLASGTLTPAQKQEFQSMILEWRRQNPHQRYVGSVRFIEFATALGKKPQTSSSSTSIFSLLMLDPFAGLDPTTAAIEEAQQFAERMMYYGQRMPGLLSWQAQVATLELANQPESLQILTNAQQLGTAADTLSKVAGQLPQVINDQREAAINQIFDRLAAGQTNSLVLLAEARATLDAGTESAQSVNTAIKSLDEFVRSVSTPHTGAAATNSHPFNVLDYGTAAAQIGAAAKDLNATLQSLNQTTPQLVHLSEEATANANRVVTRAFWLGLVLILTLLVGAVLAGLAYRVQVKKIEKKASDSTGNN